MFSTASSCCEHPLEMPAALAPLNLSLVEPTKEEIAEARKILKEASGKDVRSKMATMSAWLQTGGKKDNEHVKSTRGDERKKYLENFLVHTMRSKAKVKSTTNAKTISQTEQNFDDEEWLCAEQLEVKFGARKAAILKTMLKETQPCSLTGDNSEDMKEYKVTSAWKRKLHDSSTIFGLSSAGEATEDDMKLMDDLSAQSSGLGSGNAPPQIQVKTEPKTKAELEEQAFKELQQNIAVHLRRFQDYDLEVRQLSKFLLTVKFSESLIEGLKQHQVRLTKMMTMLAKACEHDVDRQSFKKLTSAMKLVRTNQCELVAAGQRQGFKPTGKKRKAVE